MSASPRKAGGKLLVGTGRRFSNSPVNAGALSSAPILLLAGQTPTDLKIEIAYSSAIALFRLGKNRAHNLGGTSGAKGAKLVLLVREDTGKIRRICLVLHAG